MSLSKEIEMILGDELGEARMRDVRRHRVNPPSGSQVERAFKEALTAVSQLGGKLQRAGMMDLSREASLEVSRIISMKKRFDKMRDRGDLIGMP